MVKLVVHRTTNEGLRAFANGRHHAILISGPSGSGRSSIARLLAATLVELTDEKIDQHPYVRVVRPETGKTLGIDAVREIEHFMQLKVPGTAAINRVVIIEDAHRLSIEAQNALLKTLEEPPAGSRLIMTGEKNSQALLPTVRSRMQELSLVVPPKADLESYFLAQDHTQDEVDRAYQISGGLPGLMQAILNDAEHPLLAAIEKARQLLQQPVFERLTQVDELAKNRELADNTLFILQHMADLKLQTAAGKESKHWQAILKASYEASEALAASGQPKLVLTNFMLGF